MVDDGMSVFAETIMKDKYAHELKNGSKETWDNISYRVSKHVMKAVNADKHIVEKIKNMISKRKFMPGGRYLYASGRPYHQVQNCFTGDTKFLTKNGIKTFEETVGQTLEVRNKFGDWETAEVRCFGEQEVYKITLANDEKIFCTKEHLWWQPNNERVPTSELEEVMLPKLENFPSLDKEAIKHGIIFGDGHVIKNKNTKEAKYSQIIFVNKEKDQSLVSYFQKETKTIEVGSGAKIKVDTIRETKRGTIVSLQPKHYKKLPDAGTCSPEYARGFIAGLIATDGCVSKHGSVMISCEGFKKAKKIGELAVLAGCVVTSVRISNKINPYNGQPREMSTVFIKPRSAPVILPSHLEKIKNRNLVYRNMTIEVLSVESTGRFEPVFCVVAPKTESFTLSNGIVTSNCLLLKAEDSREGWSELLHKASMALMTGAGIGIDYSAVRPEGKLIRKTGGVATGPIALMQMVNEVGRGVMQGGSRRCLPKGSMIHTKQGLKKIENVRIGEYVQTFDGYQKVLNNFDQGLQKTLKIKTQNGFFECTENHRIAVLTDVHGQYEWKKAKDLENGDRLIFNAKPIEGKTTFLPELEYTKSKYCSSIQDIKIPELDEDMAWFLGLIHGDGTVGVYTDNNNKTHGRVSVACSFDYPKIKDKAVEQLNRFGVNVFVRNGDGKLWTVGCHSMILASYLQSWFKKPNQTITIPDCILEASSSIRSAYLAGLMDADGSFSHRPVNIASSIYPEYLEQVQNVLASLGVASRFKEIRKAKNNWKSLYVLGVCNSNQLSKLKETVGKYCIKGEVYENSGIKEQFSYSFSPEMIVLSGIVIKNKKAAYSMEYIEKRTGKKLKFTPVNVLSISEGEEKQTYDIEVENEHNFYCNGYLVHNSAIWAGLSWKHQDVFKFIKLKNWIPEVVSLKEKDYNFPATLDGTNISVQLDDEFFKAFHDEKHSLHAHSRSVYWETVRGMLKSGEPGFSVDTGANISESLRNACCEVTSSDDSDICNLGSINLARIESLEEMKEITELATMFLLAGTVYSDVPYAKVDLVRNKNRRLGLGLMGIHEWLLKNKKPYGQDVELEEYLKIYSTSTEIAAEWAEKWDLTKPVKTRAIAPTGTIGIVAETTTGIEPIFCAAYKRRYKKGMDMTYYQYVLDPTAKRMVEKYDINPDLIEDAYSLASDVERRIAFQAWVQQYVDHAISSTINLPEWGSELNNENKVMEFGNMLIKYLPKMRGITCYPDGARGGQPLTPVKYNTASKHIGEVFVEQFDVCDITKGGSCGS